MVVLNERQTNVNQRQVHRLAQSSLNCYFIADLSSYVLIASLITVRFEGHCFMSLNLRSTNIMVMTL